MRQGVQFAVLILMARLLDPEDFGLIGMLTLFVAVATIFVDGGFGSALIQKQNTSIIEQSTVFYFNLGMAIGVSLLLCFVAPSIAVSFQNPDISPILRVMAFNIFVNATGAIHTTLLTKAMNFKLIAKVGSLASIISGILALTLAFKGYGVWSLVAQTVTSSLISVVLLWCWHDWRPVWKFSFESLREFFRFGGYLLVIGIIDTLHSNLYAFLISKFYSMRSVGFYDRAQKTQLLPVNFLMLIVNRVAFSAFSTVASDKVILAQWLRKAQNLLMFVNIPLSVILIVLAEPVTLLLFGENWRDSAPILRVLGFDGLLWPMHMLNIIALKAQGRSDLFFNIAVVKKIVALSLIVAGSFYGIMAIAWAQVIGSVFSFGINAYYSKVFLDFGPIKQLRDLLPNIFVGVFMGIVVQQILNNLNYSYLLNLILSLVGGGLFYLVVSCVLRLRGFSEWIKFVKLNIN